MKNISLSILVVLYKVSPEDSETLNSIKELDCSGFDLKVVIWDNSPEGATSGFVESLRTGGRSARYISRPENTPLSRAYNEFLKMVPDAEYVLILDQDTKLPSDYLAIFRNALETVDVGVCKLFLPIVTCGVRVVSPGSLWVFKGKHEQHQEPGLRKTRSGLKKVAAITSGMIIDGAYLREKIEPFDTRLTLYGVDTKFMLDYAFCNDWLCVLPVRINHHTTLWSNPSNDVLVKRIENLFKAWMVIYKPNSASGVLVRVYIFYLGVKFFLQRRDVRFLKWCKSCNS